MIKFEAWEKDSWTKAHINYAHDCWKAAQEAVLADLEREIEEKKENYLRIQTELAANGNYEEAIKYSHAGLEDVAILTLIRSKKGGA
jgi:hypothetical protein